VLEDISRKPRRVGISTNAEISAVENQNSCDDASVLNDSMNECD
jgi:hypothetical protein